MRMNTEKKKQIKTFDMTRCEAFRKSRRRGHDQWSFFTYSIHRIIYMVLLQHGIYACEWMNFWTWNWVIVCYDTRRLRAIAQRALDYWLMCIFLLDSSCNALITHMIDMHVDKSLYNAREGHIFITVSNHVRLYDTLLIKFYTDTAINFRSNKYDCTVRPSKREECSFVAPFV